MATVAFLYPLAAPDSARGEAVERVLRRAEGFLDRKPIRVEHVPEGGAWVSFSMTVRLDEGELEELLAAIRLGVRGEE